MIKQLNTRKNFSFFLVLLSILAFTTLALGISLGPVPISLKQELLMLWKKMWGEETTGEFSIIIWQIRLPRVVLGMLVGFSLALAGCVMQGIFRNPLADPYLLGIASGSSAGAALMIWLGLVSPIIFSLGAFAGGLLAVALVYWIAQGPLGRFSNYTLILAGVAVAALFSSLTTFFIFLAEQQQLKSLLFWIMGTLSLASWQSVWGIVGISLGISFLIFREGAQLNALALGDEMAHHLGIHPEKVKKRLLLYSTLLTASCVCVAGSIGFVGLIIPHLTRLLVGADQRILLLFSAILGGIFLCLCDTLSRVVMPPTEIPVGIITSLFGAPFFLYLLKRGTRKW